MAIEREDVHKTEVDNVSKEDSAFGFLERSAKIVLASLAVLYAAGLFVTNFALRSLEITDFSSLRSKYIATGLWPFLLVLIAAFPWAMRALVASSHKSGTREDRRKIWRATITNFAVAFFVYLQIFYLYFQADLLTVIFQSFLLFTLSSAVVHGLIDNLTASDNNRSKAISVTLAFLLAVLVGCWTMSSDVYFSIPQQLGGGKPLSARLALTKDGTDFWGTTVDPGYLKKVGSSSISGDVQIYYETETEIVLTTRIFDDNDIYKEPELINDIYGRRKIVRMKKILVNAVLPIAVKSNPLWQRFLDLITRWFISRREVKH